MGMIKIMEVILGKERRVWCIELSEFILRWGLNLNLGRLDIIHQAEVWRWKILVMIQKSSFLGQL